MRKIEEEDRKWLRYVHGKYIIEIVDSFQNFHCIISNESMKKNAYTDFCCTSLLSKQRRIISESSASFTPVMQNPWKSKLEDP